LQLDVVQERADRLGDFSDIDRIEIERCIASNFRDAGAVSGTTSGSHRALCGTIAIRAFL
jgi:hypothetical protein